jgi:hypothetical protein
MLVKLILITTNDNSIFLIDIRCTQDRYKNYKIWGKEIRIRNFSEI